MKEEEKKEELQVQEQALFKNWDLIIVGSLILLALAHYLLKLLV